MSDGGLAAIIVEEARRLGFQRAAIVPIDPPQPMAAYERWLDAGYAGEMEYLSSPEHLRMRADPRTLLAEAKSMLVVALAHQKRDPAIGDEPASDAAPASGEPDFVPLARLRGRIAKYARSDDYHMVLRDRLVALAERLRAVLDRPVVARSCVDAAPVLERSWAERAGLGFVAKNTMLIAPGLGSHFMLGELLLDIELPMTAAEVTAEPAPPAAPGRRRCGSCRSCLDACPTQAFVDAYVLDARRCISYLTIEYHGPIPRPLRAAIGNWIFGCDVCQDVCPFNAGAGEPHDELLSPRDLEHALPDLLVLAGHRTNQLRHFVRRTSMRRITRDQLTRNVVIALGNSDDARAVPAVIPHLAHRSPIVRGHAAWALGRLRRHAGALEALRACRAACQPEEPAEFLEELDLAIAGQV